MKWITREKPKIDRIACPWLIKRFIDREAEFIYAPAEEVLRKAKELKATPYDINDVEYTHYGDHCTFDYFVKKHQIKDEAVQKISIIVRGADTDKFDLALQSAGLWAISAGLSHNYSNDHEMLEKGMIIYDALYSWAKYHEHDKHTWDPMEALLLQFFNKFMRNELGQKKAPAWARQLQETIQDQIDTNYSLNLKELSKTLKLNPNYISREFSKYFGSLSFGEYIRKQRVNKAVDLLHKGEINQAEIAYITGFSDQSHFIRVFKKHIGMTPTKYQKLIVGKDKKVNKG
jgi:AraC-like DNA-binding protein